MGCLCVRWAGNFVIARLTARVIVDCRRPPRRQAPDLVGRVTESGRTQVLTNGRFGATSFTERHDDEQSAYRQRTQQIGGSEAPRLSHMHTETKWLSTTTAKKTPETPDAATESSVSLVGEILASRESTSLELLAKQLRLLRILADGGNQRFAGDSDGEGLGGAGASQHKGGETAVELDAHQSAADPSISSQPPASARVNLERFAGLVALASCGPRGRLEDRKTSA